MMSELSLVVDQEAIRPSLLNGKFGSPSQLSLLIPYAPCFG